MAGFSFGGFEKWLLVETKGKIVGVCFDSLISAAFCSKRVWILVFWFCGVLGDSL
jgi:hypothetical protein